ncbi:MAG: hypothetical protein ACOYMG_19740, partial [Candidatus Methylumidiphilus sp.]
YLRNRLSQLDYQGALEKGLPIGSGEIESAHRHVIQERLKLPGAWWTPANVEAMLALRLARANREYLAERSQCQRVPSLLAAIWDTWVSSLRGV